jgi:phosphohistidine phosphatase
MAPERQLLLLRHAKAEAAELGTPDHDRSLTARGISEARKMAQYFREHRIDPDVVLCSTSARTRQTEHELRKNTDLSAETLFLAELYLAPWDEIVRTVRGFGQDGTRSILVIGHNPGLEECGAKVSGELVLLAPGAMALIGMEHRGFDSLGDRAGKLRGVVSAKSLHLNGD